MVQATGLTQLARQIMDQWSNGGEANARQALDHFPELMQRKSVAVDLAYEEYCLRRAAGEVLQQREFCERFPSFRASLQRRLEVDEFFEGHGSIALRDDKIVRWPEAGDEILRYRLIEELGRGAIGRVFLAEDLSLSQRQVVVKISPVGLREADTLSRLEHPNIVPVYAAEVDPRTGMTCLCMPYLGRMTLQDWMDELLDREQLPSKMAAVLSGLVEGGILPAGGEPDPQIRGASFVEGTLRWARQLALALAHTHAKGIYHLDLKPSNVLVTHRLSALLLDFNLSVAGEMAATTLGGTLPYMSPEHIEAIFVQGEKESKEGKKVDGRADVYSLGVLLHQLLSGRLPFEIASRSNNPIAAAISLRDAQERPRALLRELNPALDEDVVQIVEECLSIDREKRPASAEELGDRLQAILDGWNSWPRFVQKNRRWFFGAAAAGAAALLAGGVALWNREPEEPRVRREAAQAFAAGENATARELYKQLVVLTPKDGRAWFGLGRARMRLGEFTTATDDFLTASKLAPENGDYFACVAVCMASSYNYTGYVGAIKFFEDAKAAGMKEPELYSDLGLCLMRNSRLKEAETALLEATRRNSKLGTAWRHLVVLYQSPTPELQPLPLARALQIVDSALAADPESADLAYECACLLLVRGFATPAKSKIIDLCELAVKNGRPVKDVRGIRMLGPLASDPEFLKRVDVKAGKSYRREIPLLDPLGDEAITRQLAPASPKAS